MNVQRLTKKSLEAVEAAQNYSRELENMQIEQIHLLWALVQDQEGLIPQLLIKMDLTPQQLSLIHIYFSAKYTRLHNDANVICMGGRTIGPGLALELVDIFLNTPFEGGRHARRVEQLMKLEEK